MKKRNVTYQEWVPAIYETRPGAVGSFVKEGTGCLSGFVCPGVFHEWGTGLLETNTSTNSYTVGIVETPEGYIRQVLPEHIRFTD